MAEFERSLVKVLVHEGGYVNHPKDPGGATNRGVTQKVYDDFLKSQKKQSRSVREISSGEVEAIYRQKYWNLVKGDLLPAGVSYVVFDGAVNSGVSQSAKWLQRALGLNADGVIGPATIEAATSYPDHDRLVALICDRRMAFLKALKTFSTFGKGWTSRVNGVRAVGQAWAKGSVGPEISVPVDFNGNAKAFLSDAKSAPSRAPGDAAAGAGGLSVVISQAQEQLMPLTQIEFVAKAMAGLAIAGAAVAIGGIAYRFWAKKKADDIKDALDLAVPSA
jgi:lysozyme family protein